LRGYPDQAVGRCLEGIELARRLEDPFSLAYAQCFCAMVYAGRGDWDLCHQQGEQAMSLSKQHGFPLWLALGSQLCGLARVYQGAVDAGLQQLGEAVKSFEATGTRIGIPFRAALEAKAHLHAGKAERGLEVVADALEHVTHTGEANHSGELWRLRGELALVGDSTDTREAESYIRRALEITRAQGERSNELRAASSLVEHWPTPESMAALREVYECFEEGLETSDLVHARKLLAATREPT
jgi:predicted ATPase